MSRNREAIKYIIITPVRDEAAHLEETIRSVCAQSLRPVQWIIVDDGSTDGTGAIIDRWGSKHSWIIPVHLPDCRTCDVEQPLHSAHVLTSNGRGRRAMHAKEIEAFYRGYELCTAMEWDYLVKLDGDVGFDEDYFERCFAEFSADTALGIGGGLICNRVPRGVEPERTPRFHVRGATKIYRRACWEQIGGVVRGVGWDTVDELKAHALGWTSRTFPQLRVTHFRPTGAANGAWRNSVKNGRWSYVVGYHPIYLAVRCCHQLVKRPYLVGACGLLYGFMVAYLRREPRVQDADGVGYLQQQQLRRLTWRHSIWH